MNKSELKPVLSLEPFRHFCCTIGNLPTSYLESLTYYELLSWLCKYLEETVIPALNTNAEAITELQELFVILKNYVDNYFDNLDVQEEINNKLDEYVEDGTLERILLNYTALFKVYDTTIEMIEDENIIENQKIKTLGYYEKNDKGNAEFFITSQQDETHFQIELDNGLFATMLLKDKIYTTQLGIKADNETDNYENLQKLFTFLNNFNEYLEIVFSGNDVIKFSNTLKGSFSNKKLILDTDLQLTKTENISTENALKGIEITGTLDNMINNIIIEGNNHYIDGNGSNVTLNNSTTSGLFSAQTLRIGFINHLRIYNLVVKNGYKDCCSIGASDGIIDGCMFIGSYRDNGLSLGSSDFANPLPVIVKNCIAKGCRDLGFSTWHGKNIKFINCTATECGNQGSTVYDNTFVSVGGGFSIEVASSSISSVDSTYGTTIQNCKAINCYNYAIYCNVGNARIENFKCSKIYKTGETGLRAGVGIKIEEFTLPIIVKDVEIDVENLSDGISATSSYNNSNASLTLENIIIKGQFAYALYIASILNIFINNIKDYSTSTYGLRTQGYNSSNRNLIAEINNFYTNNHIVAQNITTLLFKNITMNYENNEEYPYPINLSRGTNVFLDGIFILSESEPDYAIRIGGHYVNEDITNIYEGIIKTNKTNTIDSAHHS